MRAKRQSTQKGKLGSGQSMQKPSSMGCWEPACGPGWDPGEQWRPELINTPKLVGWRTDVSFSGIKIPWS